MSRADKPTISTAQVVEAIENIIHSHPVGKILQCEIAAKRLRDLLLGKNPQAFCVEENFSINPHMMIDNETFEELMKVFLGLGAHQLFLVEIGAFGGHHFLIYKNHLDFVIFQADTGSFVNLCKWVSWGGSKIKNEDELKLFIYRTFNMGFDENTHSSLKLNISAYQLAPIIDESNMVRFPFFSPEATLTLPASVADYDIQALAEQFKKQYAAYYDAMVLLKPEVDDENAHTPADALSAAMRKYRVCYRRGAPPASIAATAPASSAAAAPSATSSVLIAPAVSTAAAPPIAPTPPKTSGVSVISASAVTSTVPSASIPASTIPVAACPTSYATFHPPVAPAVPVAKSSRFRIFCCCDKSSDEEISLINSEPLNIQVMDA